MNTTVKGFKPGEAVKAFHQMKAQPFTQYRQVPPGAPLASGTADVVGTLVIDLPTWTPVALVRPDGSSVLVENASTVVTSL